MPHESMACIEPGCARPAKSRRLCIQHYKKRWANETLPEGFAPKYTPVRVGDKYGKLTVIQKLTDTDTNTKYSSATWLCRCDCGGERTTSGKSLVLGKTTNCGCKRRGRRLKPLVSGLDIEQALGVQVHVQPSGKEIRLYIFKCLTCPADIRVTTMAARQHKGQCNRCFHRKRPFEHVYNCMLKTAKTTNREVTLTFEQFLVFTEIADCHYCEDPVNWKPYVYEHGEQLSRAYNLDRKDNAIGYTAENCVTCCGSCNKIKGFHFSYDEFCIIAQAIKVVRAMRKQCTKA